MDKSGKGKKTPSSSMIIFSKPVNRRARLRPTKCRTTFGHIGGLAHHITLLKEIIIMPLLYADLYRHFSIKPPRGVIFYGPPGTGKTLVAAALASEISREAGGKVMFYHRKGADILDKWVGESERKLRELFEKAKKTRPSLIFFDELDGLAPERSARNDQVHASVVTTLLALMDGLDDSSGVVVIGATNRLEAVDPALRRPGRFDRELYFPLPNMTARREILEVHTKTWKHKPSPELLDQLADATSGYCGSDLQAVCAEAVLCCLKRHYPNISKQMNSNVNLDMLKVTAEDFTKARATITPAMRRFGGCKVRKLTPFIRPLLQRQVDKIVGHIEILLPHFLDANRKYTSVGDRYAGRLLLKGSSQQGLNNYVIPALLQRFEHLHANVLDMPEHHARIIANAFQSVPSIIVLSRVDDWWDLMDNSGQMSIISMLEDLHAGLPILVLVSFQGTLPSALHAHFVYNSSIFIEMDNPTAEERRTFFSPLFFGKSCMSLWRVLHGGITRETQREVSEHDAAKLQDDVKGASRASVRPDPLRISSTNLSRQFKHDGCAQSMVQVRRSHNHVHRKRRHQHVAVFLQALKTRTACAQLNRPSDSSEAEKEQKEQCTQPTSQDSGQSGRSSRRTTRSHIQDRLASTCTMVKSVSGVEEGLKAMKTSKSCDEKKIYNLWKQTADIATSRLTVVHLELLYDALLACIFINTNNFTDAISALEKTLTSFEKSNTI